MTLPMPMLRPMAQEVVPAQQKADYDPTRAKRLMLGLKLQRRSWARQRANEKLAWPSQCLL